MKKHLTAIGNSFGIIIDKPILDLLNITKDTPLEVKTDGSGLIIRPLYDEVPGGEPEALPPPPPPVPADDDDGLGLDNEVAPPPPGPPPPAPPPPPGPAPVLDDAPEETLPPPEDAAPPPPPPPPAAHAPPPPPPPEPVAPPPPAPSGASTGGACVVVMLRDEEKMRVPLDRDEIVIGREKTCDVHLDDRALSRRHAKLERRGAALWVEDLGSANGTYVNGEEIKVATRLHGGDIIGLGHYRLHMEGVEEAASDTPVLTLSGPEGVHRFALVGEEVVIGRAQSCDISIGHKSISRRHVKITIRGREFTAEDLGSQNGIKIHNKRIKGPTPFSAGDRLEICDFVIELGFLEDENVGEDETDISASQKKPRKSRTMLIDKSALVNAAYVDGDFENARVGGKGGATGNARMDTGEFSLEGGAEADAEPAKKGKVVRGKKR